MTSSIALALAMLAAGSAAAGDGASRLAGRLPGKTDTGRTIALEVDVTCEVGRAYRMWSTRSGAESFLAPRAEVGSVGGPYTIAFFPAEDSKGSTYGTAGARVLAAEPDRFFAFEWIVFAGAEHKGRQAPPYAAPALRTPQPLPTWVELSFEPARGGARVSLRHFGFGDGEPYARSLAWFTRAWSGALRQMKQVCR